MTPESRQYDSIRTLLATARNGLARAGIENAAMEAELLLAEAAGVSRANVVSGTVEPDASAIARCEEFVARREAREPFAYIVGHKEFFSLDFQVTPAVLIPRPETEMLVAAALERIAGISEPRVLDIGTGSGAIAIAVAANAPDARVVATDVSKESLEVARRNAARLGVLSRIEFLRGDCWQALDRRESVRFDLILSNPPYVEDAGIAALEPEVRDFEPRIALTCGSDGLAFYRRIVRRLGKHLKPGGGLMVEVGAGRAETVIELFERAGGSEACVIRDLAGIARVVCASFRQQTAAGKISPATMEWDELG